MTAAPHGVRAPVRDAAASFYGTDLAHVHDTGFGAFAAGAAPGLLRMLRRAGIREGLVVDLGCGSGIWARELVRAGYDVLGIDLSEDLLAIARERVPGARFVHASIHDAELPSCAAVTAIGEILGYARDARASRAATAALLARIHEALAPGGLLAFDVAVPGREPRPRRAWSEGEGWTLCLEAAEEPRRRTLTRRISVFRRDPGGDDDCYRRSDELHTLHLYDPQEMLADLRAAGFQARRLAGYGPALRFPPGLVGFRARKPDAGRRAPA